jgi:hypothetical protein
VEKGSKAKNVFVPNNRVSDFPIFDTSTLEQIGGRVISERCLV